ncbi:clasp N terminal-domain-containing protein [Phakopsora pachyrhizi]|uniref:Clasp N terminal-domain-containing protein n=1 Tax=Phakopsora pachyrhizi TaxID=170000 RepID=A0AAV0BF21_PHAPC|nr:clasp N terminal-domain-containing protein [Phakopsora pachyrhizi]
MVTKDLNTKIRVSILLKAKYYFVLFRLRGSLIAQCFFSQITSVDQIIKEFELLKAALLQEETEDTWEKIDSSLKRFIGVVRGGGCDYPEEFMKRWKETDIVRGMVNSMLTERTRLSGTALDLMGCTVRLRSYWESAVPFYVPTIIKLLGRASKIYVTRASTTLNSLVKGTKSVAFIPYLVDGVSEKSLSMRLGCAEALLCCLNSILEPDDEPQRLNKTRSHLDVLGKRINDIEKVIKTGGRDRDPKVRAVFKQIWELYQQNWPNRADSLSQPFTPTIRRYLGISSNSSALSQPTASAPISSHRTHAPQHLNKTSGGELDRGRPPANSVNRNGLKSKVENRPASTSRGTEDVKMKSQPSSRSFAPVSNDLAVLRKAISVPLPPDDEPFPSDHEVNHATAGIKLAASHVRPFLEVPQQRSLPSGATSKRSNSTMRAQRVPLEPQADGKGRFPNGTMKLAGRAPFQTLQQSENKPVGIELLSKSSGNTNSTSANSKPLKPSSFDQANSLAPKAYKPSRSTSDSTNTAAKTNTQLVELPTRPLPKRTAITTAASSTEPPFVPPANLLNVSVRSNNHPQSRKVGPDKAAPILKQTRKAFKPTKSSSKSSSTASTTATQATSKLATSTEPSALKLSTSRPTLEASLPETQEVQKPTPKAIDPLSSLSPPHPLPLQRAEILHNSPRVVTQDSDEGPVSFVPLDFKEISVDKKLEPEVFSQPKPFSTVQPLKSFTSALEKSANTDAKEHVEPENPASESRPSPSAIPMPPWPISFSSSTPGPKICTRLPEDLIVPMSIPLPPSPNSPFLTFAVASRKKNKSALQGKKGRKKIELSAKAHSKAAPTDAMESCHSTKSGYLNAISDESLLDQSACTILASDEENEEDRTIQLPSGPEGVLVDFEHEDTIWEPRPLTLHGDLADLTGTFASNLSNRGITGEDGPYGKRQRLETRDSIGKPSQEDNSGVHHSQIENAQVKSKSPKLSIELQRRDNSVFHWDQAGLGVSIEDSNEKTLSCLKEQPDFLAEEITVNDGRSFFSNFLNGINPQNQSTPVSGDETVLFSRFRAGNRSP